MLEAADGISGVEVARAERPDVILLDVMMPGLDGWQVAESLMEDETTSHIPLIFLTARAELRDRAKGLELGGGIDYIDRSTRSSSRRASSGHRPRRRGERDGLRREKIASFGRCSSSRA